MLQHHTPETEYSGGLNSRIKVAVNRFADKAGLSQRSAIIILAIALILLTAGVASGISKFATNEPGAAVNTDPKSQEFDGNMTETSGSGTEQDAPSVGTDPNLGAEYPIQEPIKSVDPKPEPETFTYSNIGVVGCSNTGEAVEGYHDVSTNNLFWDVVRKDIGGGGLSQWVNMSPTSKYWEVFLENQAERPADAVWWMFCPASADRKISDDNVLKSYIRDIADRINSITGDVPIYFSPVNQYAPEETCGPQVQQDRSVDLVNWAIDEGLTQAGPVVGLLETKHLEKTTPTDCHLNEEGELFIGQQVADFFEAI